MSNENSKLNDLTTLLSDKNVVGDLSKNPNNASEILKKANLTNEEAQDVGNLVGSLKKLSSEELSSAAAGKLSFDNIKGNAKKGFTATTNFVKDNWKAIVIPIATFAAGAYTVDSLEAGHANKGIKSAAESVANGATGFFGKVKGLFGKK